MPTLYIVDDDGTTELIKAKLAKNINPAKATMAVLGAIENLEPPRKPRSDRGKPREPKLPLSPST